MARDETINGAGRRFPRAQGGAAALLLLLLRELRWLSVASVVVGACELDEPFNRSSRRSSAVMPSSNSAPSAIETIGPSSRDDELAAATGRVTRRTMPFSTAVTVSVGGGARGFRLCFSTFRTAESEYFSII